MNREVLTVHREKFAYFYTDAIGLRGGETILIAACDAKGADASWVVDRTDEHGFHAKLTSAIPIDDLKKFNRLTNARALVYMTAFREGADPYDEQL